MQILGLDPILFDTEGLWFGQEFSDDSDAHQSLKSSVLASLSRNGYDTGQL